MRVRGLRPGEIAATLGMSASRISTVLNSPAGLQYQAQIGEVHRDLALAERKQRIQDVIENEALPSVRKLASLRDQSDSERIQLNAANSLLDRSVPRKIKNEASAPTLVLSDTVARALMSALNESEQVSSNTIDVSPLPTDSQSLSHSESSSIDNAQSTAGESDEAQRTINPPGGPDPQP